MVRLARTADGRVVVDEDGRTFGRGAYVCASRACVDQAAEHGGAAVRRGLRGGDPHDIIEALDSVATTDENTGDGATAVPSRRNT